MQETTRHPLLAFVLGVAAPGLGLVYAGRGLLGIVLALGWIGGGVALASVVMDQNPAALARAHFAFSAFSVVLSGVASALFARRPSAKKGYEHWWWVFGFFMLAWSANSKVRELFVSKELGFAMRVPDENMAPGYALGELLVVDARAAPDPGEVIVIATTNAGESGTAVVRVLARAGQSARLDNGHLFIDDAGIPEGPCAVDDVKVPGLACASQTLGATRFVVGGEGCTVPVTSVPAGQLFVAPDARTAETCKQLAKLVQKADVLGVAVRAR